MRLCLKPTFYFMMCAKDTPYIEKFFGGCIIIWIVINKIMGAFIGISGSAEANEEMSGDQDTALIQQSSGVHLFQVNCTNLGVKRVQWWLVLD